MGTEFQFGLIQRGIKPVSITSKNPQANAVCERSHRTIKNMLRTMVHENPPLTEADATEYMETCFASCMAASRIAVHRTLGVAPGSLAFHRDMLLPIPILADYELIKQRRQAGIDATARRNNSKQTNHDWKEEDKVLVKVCNPNALQQRADGPYVIKQVHTNGTVTIERAPNVHERINTRRLKPYRE